MAEFAQHLERQFVEGMSWQNYGVKRGQWSIDHIIPLDCFDLANPDERKRAFHFSNCRPLWTVENIRRSRQQC
jgi:hypothetical protein